MAAEAARKVLKRSLCSVANQSFTKPIYGKQVIETNIFLHFAEIQILINILKMPLPGGASHVHHCMQTSHTWLLIQSAQQPTVSSLEDSLKELETRINSNLQWLYCLMG